MEKIAVIGISCLFPGAESPEEFFSNLLAQKDTTSYATARQFGEDPELYFDPRKGAVDKFYNKRGGFIQDFTLDPTGFELSAEKIRGLDDIYQWSLYVAREALKDAGYHQRQEALAQAGVILGNLSFPTKSSNEHHIPRYHKRISQLAGEKLGLHGLDRNGLDLNDKPGLTDPDNLSISGRPAAMIAEALGLGGTHMALDAACASSLYSVKLACDYLQSGKADLMLAGAVSAADPFFVNMGFSTFQAYPEGEQSYPLDKNTKGLVAGEGAGMFVLKRLSDAQRDGDKILSVISGIGLSNDGKGKFILSPNPQGQVLSYQRAYLESGVDPKDVGYIECHATGTPLGDKTELESLESFFGQHAGKPLVGSVKSNFGHMLTAAGMASMLKVIMAMDKGRLPATIHVKEPMSSPTGVIGAEGIVTAERPWPEGQRYAAVNAFGFGGTNAHLIFESPQGLQTNPTGGPELKDLAILGMEANYAEAQGLETLAELIHQGETSLNPPSEERWQNLLEEAKEGGYLEAFDFDYLHFKIPPNPKDPLIPQQLLMLKTADKALRRAGIQPGGMVAVIIAMETDPTLHRFRGRVELSWRVEEALKKQGIELSDEERAKLLEAAQESLLNPVGVNQYTSFIGNIMACRVSSLWDFKGPSLTLSSEESSVIKAVEWAQMLLSKGEAEAVVIGAVDLAGSPEEFTLTTQILSERQLALASEGKGFSLADGAGAIVLTSVEEATKQNKRILATLKEPKRLLSPAQFTPENQDYLELVGTKQIEELTRLKGEPKSLLAGSLQENLGNAKVAGTMAGLIKTALLVERGFLPANAGIGGETQEDLELAARLQESPFYLAEKSRPWLSAEGRKASLLLLDGDCHQLDLEEAPKKAEAPESAEAPEREKTSDSPQARLAQFPFLLRGNIQQGLAQLEGFEGDLAQKAKELYELHKGAQGPTLVLLAGSHSELAQEVELAKKGITKPSYSSPRGSSYRESAMQGKLAFLFGGGFSSHLGMQADLGYRFPKAMQIARSLSEDPASLMHLDLFHPRELSALSAEERKAKQEELYRNPLAMFESGIMAASISARLAQEQFKIEPDFAMGYSMGEVSMMLGMKAWTSADPLKENLESMPTFTERLAGPKSILVDAWGEGVDWKVYGVRGDLTKIKELAQGTPKCRLLLINSPTEAVLGGDDVTLAPALAASGLEYAPSPMTDVVHCNLVKPEHADLVKLHFQEIPEPPKVRFLSALNYGPFELSAQQAAANIAGIYVKELDFPKLVESAYDQGVRLFLEVGPGSSVTKWITETLEDREHLALSLDQKGQDSGTSYLKGLAQLLSHGVKLDLSSLFSHLPEVDEKPARSLVQRIPTGGIPLAERLGAIAPLHPNFTEPEHTEPVTEPELAKPEHTEPVTEQATEPELAAKTQPGPQATAPNEPTHPQETVTEQATRPTETKAHALTARATTQVQGANLFGDQEEALAALMAFRSKVTRAHQAFLAARKGAMNELAEMIRLKKDLVAQGADAEPQLLYQPEAQNAFNARPYPASVTPEASSAPEREVIEPSAIEPQAIESSAIEPQKVPPPMAYPPLPPEGPKKEAIWSEDDLMEFACGKIENVFGPEYAVIDTYGPRVRLPMPPYLLVNRVTAMDAVKGEFKPSTMTTEYDVPKDAWYTLDGQIPWAIAVEAGQCDLLLISYLGIDFEAKGKYLYRLLDCTLTFKGDMPKEGDTLRYEISINSFARHGHNLLFFFSYECYVGEDLVHTMTDGCAGFFSTEDLAKGKGVIRTDKELKERAKVQKQSFQPLLTPACDTFSHEDLLSLSRGNIPACFGLNYDQRGLNPGLRFSSEEFLMLERITKVERAGGIWGLGMVHAEKTLKADDWYFPCHFKDDNCLAGSLMAEGCVQLLQFYLLYLGLQVETKDAVFVPIKDLANKVRCRGQVIPGDELLEYRMEVTEIGLHPRPYAKANVDIILDGRVIVDFTDVGVELVERSEPKLMEHGEAEQNKQAETKPAQELPEGIEDPAFLPLVRPLPQLKPAQYNEQALWEFALGSLSKAFGPEYDLFEGKPSQRNPNRDLQLTTRVISVNGERHALERESSLVAEYDVPQDAWFLTQNGYPYMPYSVMMEIALQPCGFLGAVMGSPLVYPDVQLCYRNLDATAQLLSDPELAGKTIVAKAWLYSTSKAVNTLIQQYGFELWVEGEKFYEGKTTFGYFTPKALADQKGMDGGKSAPIWGKENGEPSSRLDLTQAAAKASLYVPKEGRPFERLGVNQLDFLDYAECFAQGGKHGQGYVYAKKQVDANDWFFPMHFHEDPVMPGSLGVEAILQSLRIYALDQGLTKRFANPRFAHALDQAIWKYRGQIVPENDLMEVDVHIKSIEETEGATRIACEANLFKDGLRIYQIDHISLDIREAD